MSNVKESACHVEGLLKKRILNAEEYNEICDYIDAYPGLPIDCAIEIRKIFPGIDCLTLKGILELCVAQQNRKQHFQNEANGPNYFERYKALCQGNSNSDVLLQVAKEYRIGPVMVCRNILKTQYQLEGKKELTRMLRHPHLIEDSQLSTNVIQCLCSDSQDGMLTDLRKRVMGEEYELKLKQMANAAGLHYIDENELRRLGYDKTPDLKMILPFLYKNEVINWLESKAIFADIKTHKYYTQQQYKSYCNRFGAGIVIYWCGYLQEVANLELNNIGINVLDNFPAEEDIQLIDLSATNVQIDGTS